MRQPALPKKSSELNRRLRKESPWRRLRACNSSVFSKARFRFEGHSFVQALHERQLLNAASNSSERRGSALFEPRASSTARMALARPRVDMISSPVAMKVGHIVGVSLRQPPQPLHCSRFRVNDLALAANANTGVNGRVSS